jgi:hypothetical protein
MSEFNCGSAVGTRLEKGFQSIVQEYHSFLKMLG